MMYFRSKSRDDKAVDFIVKTVESWGYTPLEILHETRVRHFKKIRHSVITFFYQDKNNKDFVEMLAIIYRGDNGELEFYRATKEETSSFNVKGIKELKEMDEEIKK